MENEINVEVTNELHENLGADFGSMPLEDDGDGNDVYSSDLAGGDGSFDEADEVIDLSKTTDKVDIDKQPAQSPAQQPTQQPVTKDSLIEMLKDPAIVKMLAELNKPHLSEQLHKAPESKPLTPPVSLDKLEFTPEETANPQTFGKAIASKVMSMVDSMVASKVQEIMEFVEPVRGEYSRNLYQKEVDAITADYGDMAKPYFEKGTPQYNQLAEKFINTPGITIKEAFMLLNPQKPADIKKTIDTEAEKKAQMIIQQKQQASTRVPINKTPMVKTESNKISARQAALKAMGLS